MGWGFFYKKGVAVFYFILLRALELGLKPPLCNPHILYTPILNPEPHKSHETLDAKRAFKKFMVQIII